MSEASLPLTSGFIQERTSPPLRQEVPDSPDLPSTEDTAQMDRIHSRGDKIVGRFILLHLVIAVLLAPFFNTWLITGVVGACATAMFFISARLLPRSVITRCIAGVSLQIFVALHIYQLHGLAEMHFFYFTASTVLIVYQDWKCLWPGTLFIIIQHTVFALLHNSGVNVFFFEDLYVGMYKLSFHFGIVLGQAGICGYWAHLLKRQTIASTRQNARLQKANTTLRTEMAERQRMEKALREAQGQYRRIADNMPGVVYQFLQRQDGSFAFPYMSRGCREVFEVEPEEAMSDSSTVFARIHPEERPAMIESISESAATLQPWRWEGRLVMDGGRTKWIQASSRPAKQSDGTILWDGVVVDVTELKRAEAELRVTKEEAERANLAKSEFLSRMSHELRTPLNAILGFGQLLDARSLPEFEKESVQHILKGGRHLLGLINEVLDISRIEAGRLELSIEPVRVVQVLEEATALIRPLATQRQIQLQIPDCQTDCCFALADVQRLKQVLLNLLSNAIKYNRDGGEVIVECESLGCGAAVADGNSQGRVRITVRDTGAGITPDNLPRLFTPFERLGAEHTQIEGSGVGLALSKRLIEAMNGRIGVESTPGHGSSFFIDLPITAAPVKERTEPQAPHNSRGDGDEENGATGQQWRTVLHVEDNLANRHLMEQVFDAVPCVELITAIQGGIALDLARKHLPALILLDMHLPDISGAEVLARLRADPRTREIPVVIVSADATRNQIQRLLAMGARKYLTKPFDIGELLATIDELLAPQVSLEEQPTNGAREGAKKVISDSVSQ